MLVVSLAVAASAVPLRVGVILGRNHGTVDTSDQEQWAVEQARLDVVSELAKAGGHFTLQLSTVFTGEDAESPLALAAVRHFLQLSSANGTGIIVGAYLSETSLLAIRALLAPLGLTLLAPASGLPTLPSPRERILRFWPSDKWQSDVLAHVVHHRAAVLLSRDDLTGRALSTSLATSLGSALLHAPLYYNATLGARSYGPLLDKIRFLIGRAAEPTVAFVCNCGPDEIANILDAMNSSRWPISQTSLVLTDRATPTRSIVAVPSRKMFAAAVNTTGVLSHLPTTSPSYMALAARWRGRGQSGSLFASALSAYDAVRIAALASVLVDGSTVNASGLPEAARGVADQHWGASGMMTLDAEGDLYRAVYDRYVVDADKGWRVQGPPVDAKNLLAI